MSTNPRRLTTRAPKLLWLADDIIITAFSVKYRDANNDTSGIDFDSVKIFDEFRFLRKYTTCRQIELINNINSFSVVLWH